MKKIEVNNSFKEFELEKMKLKEFKINAYHELSKVIYFEIYNKEY
jgi:hypothetical protein